MTASTHARHRSTARRENSVIGALSLSRHIVRRDRLRMTVWVLGIAAFLAYFMMALTVIFDKQALEARAMIMETPSGIVMGGPGYGIEHYTGPVAVANEGTAWTVLALAIMSILHVVRHTRAEEESERAELVRAAPVGRHAAGVATMATLIVHLVVIAVVGAFVLVATSSGEAHLADALAMMFGCAAVALVFGGVAFVTAQLSAHARAASGIALAVFAVAFAIRAAGDLQQRGGSVLSWFSPIAWAQQMRAFVDLRWWPILLSLALTLVCLIIGGLLAARRDFGAGLVRGRSGRATARSWLRGPLALAVRQHRGALIWTTIGVALTTFATGTLMDSLNSMVADLVDSNPAFGQIFGTDPERFGEAFVSMIMMFTFLGVAAYATVAGLRSKAEEESGRMEVALAAPVSRLRWFSAQLTACLAGTTVLWAVSAYALWAGSVSVGVGQPDAAAYTAQIIAYLPALWIFVAVTLLLWGWVPPAAPAAWLLLAFVLVVGIFGSVFDLPDAVQALSPLHWVPEAFGSDSRWQELWPDTGWLFAVAVVLVAAAAVGFRRRGVRTR